jgi:hypothetical protein
MAPPAETTAPAWPPAEHTIPVGGQGCARVSAQRRHGSSACNQSTCAACRQALIVRSERSRPPPPHPLRARDPGKPRRNERLHPARNRDDRRRGRVGAGGVQGLHGPAHRGGEDRLRHAEPQGRLRRVRRARRRQHCRPAGLRRHHRRRGARASPHRSAGAAEPRDHPPAGRAGRPPGARAARRRAVHLRRPPVHSRGRLHRADGDGGVPAPPDRARTRRAGGRCRRRRG